MSGAETAAIYGGGMRSAPDRAMPGIVPPSESSRPTLVGDRFMVSAGHPIVAQVAARALDQGGNAIDAGVAGGLASNVVQADVANFGGIAPLLVRCSGSSTVWSVSGVGTWSRTVTLPAFVDAIAETCRLAMPRRSFLQRLTPGSPLFNVLGRGPSLQRQSHWLKMGSPLDARTASTHRGTTTPA